jgi:copper homeostasis protein
MFIERCVTTLAEAEQAVAEGADRLELCSALELDGLTADRKAFLDIKKSVNIPVRVMLRNRHPHFEVNVAELGELKDEADWFKQHGADGFVFGFMAHGKIDEVSTAELLGSCAPLPCTFHKAFDSCESLTDSLELLINLGVDDVLTSGGERTAAEGTQTLRKIVSLASTRIGVIVAGNVRHNNIANLHQKIKATYYHFRVE